MIIPDNWPIHTESSLIVSDSVCAGCFPFFCPCCFRGFSYFQQCRRHLFEKHGWHLSSSNGHHYSDHQHSGCHYSDVELSGQSYDVKLEVLTAMYGYSHAATAHRTNLNAFYEVPSLSLASALT